jgi:hypothetical protein
MNIVSIKHTTAFFQKELAKYTPAVFFQKYKINLTPRFCFENLYGAATSDSNGALYYNEIVDYYRPTYSLDEIVKVYDTVTYNFCHSPLTRKSIIYKKFCKGDCANCDEQKYCF